MWPLDLLHDSAWRPLCWTLLHFLWQGLLVAAVWAILFRLFQARSTSVRYVLGLAGMLVMAACPVATIVLLQPGTGWNHYNPDVASAITLAPMPAASGDAATSLATVGRHDAMWGGDLIGWIDDIQPYLLAGWIAGLVLLSSRLLVGVAGVHRLRRSRRAISAELLARSAALARRIGFRRVPGVFASGAAREAMVAGFFRPMVLLPVAWLAEMTPEVLDAVIAHELAHIRRFDLWLNLLQRFVETLLFYHPAVWWLSRRVRLAREMCCDELAARATGDCMAYANALEQAARKRLAPHGSLLEVALGVTQMTLLNRVRNVLGVAVRPEQGRWWPAAVLVLFVPAGIWLASATAVTSAQEEKQAKAGDNSASEQSGGRGGRMMGANTGGKYTATSLLKVSMQDRPILSGGVSEMSRDRFDIYKATQRQLLLSRFVLIAALRPASVAKLPVIQNEKDPVSWLASRLRVTFPGGAELMEVSLSSDDPKEAMILVNAVVRAYLDEVVNAELNQKRIRLSELDRAFVEKETDVRAKRDDLKKMAESLGTSDSELLTMKQKLALEELSIYRQELAKVQADLRVFQRELAVQKALLPDADPKELATIRKEVRKLEIAEKITKAQAGLVRDEVAAKLNEAKKFGESTVDLEMMRAEIKNSDFMLAGLTNEREKLRVEIRSAPRVSLLLPAEDPSDPPRPPAAEAKTRDQKPSRESVKMAEPDKERPARKPPSP